ncbi:hypothetical protein K435DRAFT_972187 [Dendrothele bispora CBS 962.96]|uniref:Aminoglycoside phosphotransferase domain-containing protein n=1 Tax=Dendrothele bispora (strain CBS 962.96) TaxID=1314807 RepID=A0A4S8L0I1_DENBC|nr:hypothetical protein K435DRAFT_972187 [Dendrothele bispora CBS 962.96]
MQTVYPGYPSRFSYKWSFRPTSLLWWLWLKFPQSLRARAYRVLIRWFQLGEKAHVSRLRFGIYAKTSHSPDEALAIEFVRAHTSIPVPQVLDVIPYSPKDESFPDSALLSALGPSYSWLTLMTALPGQPLFEDGVGIRLVDATEEQRAVVGNVLSDWISQLRNIPPSHPQRVCGFSGGSFKSHRISGRRVGPFDNPAEFHAQSFCTVVDPAADERVERLVAERPHKKYRICLTHGDLLLHNILADDNYRPIGLVDWECAAWMPEYWETASSFRSWFSRMFIWKDIVLDSFPKYEDDLLLEYHIQNTYDP